MNDESQNPNEDASASSFVLRHSFVILVSSFGFDLMPTRRLTILAAISLATLATLLCAHFTVGDAFVERRAMRDGRLVQRSFHAIFRNGACQLQVTTFLDPFDPNPSTA